MAARAAHDLREYYARRTLEYEVIYEKPERQTDLDEIRRLIAQHCVGRRVLEIACGTGYWTRDAARVAQVLTATDAVREVLEFARLRQEWPANVCFVEANAYALDASSVVNEGCPFNAAFAGFWLSHVPRRRVAGFLSGLNAVLDPGSAVLLFDNRYVEGSSSPIAFRDRAGDTYQRRSLADGSEFDVLKNFLEAEELAEIASSANGIEYESISARALAFHWVLTYRTAG
jgi:ubiquinone/menaquinone biosynthesis C-methylase UbiE